MFITSGGNVGIGITAPPTNLSVKGSPSVPTAATYNGIFGLETAGQTSFQMGILNSVGNGTWFQTYNQPATGGGTFNLYFNPLGGNVLIGTTTDNGYKLNCNGQPGANGYTAWTNYSDSRLKENVTDLDATNVLDKICAIRPVTYNYNKLSGFDEDTRARRISGFIAQELIEVFPEMVGTIKKEDVEYYDTNLSNLNLYLVKAIQELSKQNEELSNRLIKLESK
jgi:hypothetical protein